MRVWIWFGSALACSVFCLIESAVFPKLLFHSFTSKDADVRHACLYTIFCLLLLLEHLTCTALNSISKKQWSNGTTVHKHWNVHTKYTKHTLSPDWLWKLGNKSKAQKAVQILTHPFCLPSSVFVSLCVYCNFNNLWSFAERESERERERERESKN